MRTIFHVVTPDDTSLEEMRRVADVVKTAVFDAENGVIVTHDGIRISVESVESTSTDTLVRVSSNSVYEATKK
jgi:hypothetical protein